MPLYEYCCTACGHRFERIQKFSDPIVDTCPSCGGAVEKLLSAPAFQLKGTGWYVTDYAAKDKGAADKGSSDGSGKSETTDKSASAKDSGTPESSDKKDKAASSSPEKPAPAATSGD
jgi:putative FmdB family regulatory protein